MTPWTVACQASLSMEFSRQVYWSGFPFPSPRGLLDLGLMHCRQILYHLSHKGSPVFGGVAFLTHPGSQASSRGEAKDTALLSSRDGYILELTVWPKMGQASCGVWREDSVLLSMPGRKEVSHLVMTGAYRGFSRAAAPVWGFTRNTTGSVQFSRSVVSDSLRHHESQHARTPCPSPTPRVHSDSRPLSQ